MTDNNQALDNELAEFTDRLLAGDEMSISDDIRDLVGVVEQLHHLTAPDPDIENPIHERIRLRLSHEWDHQYSQRMGRFRVLRSNRARRLIALAATLIIVLGATVLATSLGDNGGETLQGTASGPAPSIVIVVVVLAGLGLAAWWYTWQRRP